MAAFTGNSIVGQVIAGDGHVVSSGQHGIVNGAPSSAAFGVLAPKTAISLMVFGVTSAQAFGVVVPTIANAPQTTVIPGLGSAQSFGVPLIARGAVIVQVAGISRDVAVPGYIGLEASGHVLLEDGSGLLLEAAAAGGEVLFGAPTLRSVFTVVPLGIGSAQSFGALTLSATITKLVGGVASAQQFGSAVAKPPPTTVPVGGVPTARSFGTVTVVWSQIVQVPGLPQQTGMRSIVGGVISGDGHVVLGSGLLFGFPKLIPGKVTVSFATLGLGSAQRFGVPWIAFWQPLPILGVPSAQQFGSPLVFKVWVRQIACVPLDLDAITCTSMTLATGAVTEITLTSAVQTNLDLTASEADDLDLQPAGCD